MSETIITILPLALASAISPADFVVLIKILAGAQHQRRNALAFILGGASMYVLVLVATVLAFEHSLGHPPVMHHPHNLDHAIVNFTLAGLAVFLFIRMLTACLPEKSIAEAKPADGPVSCYLLGLGMKLLSLNALLPFIGAVHEVSESGLWFDQRVVVFGMAIAIAILPMLVPFAVFLLNEQLALKLVVPIGNFIDRNKARVVKIALPLVAVIFCYHGFVYLGWLK